MFDSKVSQHSCEHCQSITIHETGIPDKLKVHFSFFDVKEMAKSCTFFNWTLRLPTASLLRRTDKLLLSVSDEDGNPCYLVASWIDKDDKYIISQDETQEESMKSMLHIFASDDNCAGKYIKPRPFTESTADPTSLRRCKEQLDRCMLLHKECKEMSRKSQTTAAPARLLYISKGSPVRLCEIPEAECPKYVALSYCWGKNEHQKNSQTIKANFKDRLQEVESSQLPKTIVDAIEVTQSLGLPYIWVDALCIIQDDQEDRQKEIANMANIYRSATITIVAACAEESTEGFLGVRKLAEAYGGWFRVPYRATNVKAIMATCYCPRIRSTTFFRSL
ncbi:HET-domain-containing protein [Periconia macrospinosa]|uniref:HET-domain-containing protein n=1 Tax=Periconia macrospinosa TaxID=97972 RepID=A0A2V1D345_9PLEO|nr:HET-domain-containing protein [Periconia macrospinosa]